MSADPVPRIAVVPGDGIGVEVIGEAVRVLRAAAGSFDLSLELERWDLGAERYLRDGATITDEELRTLERDFDAILLGALGDPRVPDNAHARDILLGLRSRLDLFVNYRPCRLLLSGLSPLTTVDERGIRLEIFRENTEGAYVDMGGSFKTGTEREVAIQEDVNTYHGVERIVRAAFEHARERDRDRVTMVDKANALPRAGALWRRVFDEVGRDFPSVEREALFVDAAAMDLVRRPSDFEILVTSNLFGDILSDLAAQLTGGLGLAPSANLHPGRHALFEPVHGSAPDIAGSGRANPVASIRCTVLLLDHFGHESVARRVEEAVVDSLRSGVTTPELGGDSSTEEVGRWIAEAVSGST